MGVIKALKALVEIPCDDVNKESYIIPDINIKPENIRIVMISEASPEKVEDYFYAGDDSFYMQTTLNAFKDAGLSVSTMKDIVVGKSAMLYPPPLLKDVDGRCCDKIIQLYRKKVNRKKSNKF